MVFFRRYFRGKKKWDRNRFLFVRFIVFLALVGKNGTEVDSKWHFYGVLMELLGGKTIQKSIRNPIFYRIL